MQTKTNENLNTKKSQIDPGDGTQKNGIFGRKHHETSHRYFFYISGRMVAVTDDSRKSDLDITLFMTLFFSLTI